MHKNDLNRVVFFSKDDMAGGYYLSNGEPILRNEIKPEYTDINEVLELYNIKKYIDNELYLKSWTKEDIDLFKQKVAQFGKIIGKFISKINDRNIISYFEKISYDYFDSFWELINNQKIYKQISALNFKTILSNNPHQIRSILTNKNLVKNYNNVIGDFLMDYPQSAEILLTIYEVKNDTFRNKEMHIPKCLSILDKENIVSNYIDSAENNLNYLRLIKYAKNKDYFKISDETRLKAKRKEQLKTNKIFKEQSNASFVQYGVSVSFSEEQDKIKSGSLEDSIANYTYSLPFIRQKSDFHSLFLNFIILFEYLDIQHRIDLVNKINQMGVLERFSGISSQNEYNTGIAFNLSEMTSQAQIVAYYEIVNGLGKSLENILQYVFSSVFNKQYNFAKNAKLHMPSMGSSSLEKVRFIAPEFESILKQFKLFVTNGEIDFELLQMSSTPTAIKDIPSLNQNKYIYLSGNNKDIVSCSNLFFSDQTLLAYVAPYENKHYENFFDLLANEEEINFDNYEEHQKPHLNHLIERGLIHLDKNNFIQITNIPRVLILKDLYENEFASFYHYPKFFQYEVNKMKNQDMVFFDSSLLSKPEQSYFNYYLNKSEYTNGLDLRNSYLHGTQANPEETEKHKNAYFTYLKLLVLILLKIEDDLLIFKTMKK